MIGKFLSLTAAGLLALCVEASAQVRQAEIYHDQYGREVLVDRQTGEILGIREGNGAFRPLDRQPPVREAQPRERYDYDYRDRYPGEMTRRERRMRELGRFPDDRFPSYRDYRALPDPDYGDDYDSGWGDEPWQDEDYAREEPWSGGGHAREEPWRGDPRLPGRDQVERAPLNDPSVASIPDEGTTLETIIEQAPPAGLPGTADQPQPPASGVSEDVAKIQVLLDRVGASPGVIDGRMGDNVNKAIGAYRDLTGETLRTYDRDYVDAQLAATGGDAFKNYEITAADAAGPFVASVPSDYGEKARLEHMSYTSVVEKLAERFHMDERYLRELNPGVNFDRPGTIIRVTNVGEPKKGTVSRIVADKGARQVRAYGADGRLIVAYPSTIGSEATPSPSGTHTVERIALDPEYTYNPKINFQQGENTRVLTIPPGPNGPVGTVWIALSKPTYGIHGTPDPSKIGKTNSNGCIRLTNWDAQELAKMVSPGVTVEFVE